MTAKPDDKKLVEVAGRFHDDTFDEDGNPEPKRPWSEVWKGWLEAKKKADDTASKGQGEITLLPGVRRPKGSA